MNDADGTESPEPAPAPRKGPPLVPSVTKCGLILQTVRLVRLICQPCPKQLSPESPPLSAEVVLTAELFSNTPSAFENTPSTFEADVLWNVDFGDDPPMRIDGVHRLSFSTTTMLEEPAVQYYAQINSAVLAYPYLRQLVDDICMRSLGQCTALKPLDVPKFVLSQRVKWLQQLEEAPETGAAANVTDDPAE